MTSIDDLFKAAGSAQKRRKLDPTQNPNERYAAISHTTNGHSNHYAKVEDEEDDEVAGPALPPDEEEEDGVEEADDEEGRFFGGGVDKSTTRALDYLDSRDAAAGENDEGPEKIDTAWLRKMALNFERRISRNAEQRAKFEDDPQKFMSSEADLDAEIKALAILAEHPELYKAFADLGCVDSLVSLLAHENTDIAIDAIEILAELTADDVDADDENWQALLQALLQSDLADLVGQNLARLDETNDADRSGVYHCLSLVENLAADTKLAEKLTSDSELLQWLLGRIQRKESATSQNKQYAAETLAILLQSSPRIRGKAISLDAVDTLLQLLSAYRKRDPHKDAEEEEYAENLFDALTCLVGQPSTAEPAAELDKPEKRDSKKRKAKEEAADIVPGKSKFIEGEGIELCLIMLREGKYSKPRALRVLDHAMGGAFSAAVCEQFVEAAGLKPLFSLFMKHDDTSMTEHVVGIFASLLRQLPGDSAPRIRVLAKFVEKDFEKTAKLVRLRQGYAASLARADAAIAAERADLDEEDQEALEGTWLSRRLDAGLFCFQTISVVLAWLIAEDEGAKQRIQELLTAEGLQLANITAVLKEQLDDLTPDGADATLSDEDGLTVDMLRTLISCLEP